MQACAQVVDCGASALVPAAGSGERLGMGPKGQLQLLGRPLLCWVADKLQQVADEVIVAVPAASVKAASQLLPGCRVIAGGDTRHDTVALLAEQARGEWVLVHDVARPFASVALFGAVLQAARTEGCAGAFLDPEVPVARVFNGRAVEALDRHEVGVFQSPQAFSRALLLGLLRDARVRDWRPQSTMQLALRAGLNVVAVAGEKSNIKITTAQDWRLANAFEDHLK